MDYHIKLFLFENNRLTLVGVQSLADLHTFDHYLSLIANKTPFGIDLEWSNAEYSGWAYLKFFVKPLEQHIEVPEDGCLVVVTSNREDISYKTSQEYHNQTEVQKLIDKLDFEKIKQSIRNNID